MLFDFIKRFFLVNPECRLFPHFGGGVTKHQIGHSLRLRASASAHLSTTAWTSGGTPNKLTISAWVKRGQLGAGQYIAHTYYDANTSAGFYFDASDRIGFWNWTAGAYTVNKISNAVFRDPSAHYHVVLIIDTTLATAEDRFQIWVNNQRITSWNTNTNTHTQNAGVVLGYAASGATQRIGGAASGGYFDGLISDVHYLWANKAAATDFGKTDENGVWVPKRVSGVTYGAYGGHLDFSNGTSLTTLGYSAVNSNHWTLNSVSLTAGVNYDWMTDTPTNNSFSLNPLTASSGYSIAPTDANLTLTCAAGANVYLGQRGLEIPTTGKWYWECNMGVKDATASQWYQVGVCSNNLTFPSSASIGAYNGGWAYYNDGQKGANASYSAYGATFGSGDVIGVAYDADAATLTFYKNGVSQGQAFSSVASNVSLVPAFQFYRSTGTAQYMYPNFGQRPFAYTPPSGFKALCTANLPSVTVPKPSQHFDVKTHAGNSTNPRTFTGVQFQPDLIWMKRRNIASSHLLLDVVRGFGLSKELSSDSNGAEGNATTNTAAYGCVTAATADGFTVNAGSTNADYVNTTGSNYVDWLWKANGAGASNTSGSITSTVSANTTAGFSIVTYTGTGVSATVGHGLGVAPKLVIVKDRTAASTNDWAVYHAGNTSAPETDYLLLNSTAATADDNTYWSDTAPTSSVFSVGTNNDVNQSGHTYVAYCFAEIPGYSKIGSYTGNGSVDGPFVWCGFRPKFIMLKDVTTGATNWVTIDSGRDTYNVAQLYVGPNTSAAEGSAVALDITANGFKLRAAGTPWNANNANHIFAAFAEHPTGGSNVAPAPAR